MQSRAALLFTIGFAVALFFIRLPTVENRSLGANESTTLLTAAGHGHPNYPAQIETPQQAAQELFGNVTTYKDVVHELETSDGHPPTYYWLLITWDRFFGSGLTSARTLSNLLGSLFVIVLGLLVISELPLTEYLLFELLVGFSSTLAYFATEARSYIFCLILVLLAIALTLRFLRSPFGRLRATAQLALIGFVTGLSVFTNYLMILIAFCIGIWILIERRARPIREIAGNAVTFAIPNILFCFAARHFYELQHDVHASNRNGYHGLKSDLIVFSQNFIRAFVNRVDLGTTVFIAIFLMTTLGVLFLRKSERSNRLLLIAGLTVAAVVGSLFVIDFAMVKFMYPFRYFILAAPGLFLLVAVALATEKTRALKVAFNGLIVLVIAVELSNFNWRGDEIGRTDYSRSPVREPVSEILKGSARGEKVLVLIERTLERDWPTGIIGDLARRPDDQTSGVDVFVLPKGASAIEYLTLSNAFGSYKKVWYMANDDSSVPAREALESHSRAHDLPFVVRSESEWGYLLEPKTISSRGEL